MKSDLSEFTAFCNLFWSHPFFKAVDDPSIRLSLLPSQYLTKKLKSRLAAGEFVVFRSELEEKEKRLKAENQRGWDVFYFCNSVVVGNQGDGSAKAYATNEDVERRLYLPIDLDYRLPVPIEEFIEELGLNPWITIRTSDRVGGARHQMLFAVDGVGEESQWREISRGLCEVCGSDPIHDPKRILRAPGFINWKGVDRDQPPSMAKLVTSHG